MSYVRIQLCFCLLLLSRLVAVLSQQSGLLLYLLTIISAVLFVSSIFSLKKSTAVKDGELQRDLYSVRFPGINKDSYLALRLLVIVFVVNFQNFKIDPGSEGYITILLILAAIAIAFAGELAFRFYIQGTLTRLGLPLYKAILVAAGLFAFSNSIISFASEWRSIYSLINQFIFDYFLGVLLGVLFHFTRSLLFVTLYHFFITLPVSIRMLHSQPTFFENTITGQAIESSWAGFLWFLLYISPLIGVSLYYLWKLAKQNVAGSKARLKI